MSDIQLTAEQTAERFGGLRLTERDAVQILNAAAKMEGRANFFGTDSDSWLDKPDEPLTIGLRTVNGEEMLNLGGILWIAVCETEDGEESPFMRNARKILTARWLLAA